MSSEHRLHPYSILFAFLTQIRVFVVPGILVLFGAGSRSYGDWWQPWMMALVIPTAGMSVFHYMTYRYRYEPSELVIVSGLLFKRERHIPYARIQNIDAVQNVLHRALNVVAVRIETGGGGKAEATMSVLPFSALQEMRERVFADRHIDSNAAVPTASENAPLLKLDVRELMLCGFIENRGAVLIAAAFGLVWELGVFDRVVTPVLGQPTLGRGVIRNLMRSIISNATISWGRVALTLVVLLALLLLVRLFSMAWAVVRLHGFTLTLVDGDARSHFGLLTRVSMTVPLRRIQSLAVREGPLHHYFKRVAVKVDTAGGRVGEERQNGDREYLAPILRREALDGFIQTVIGVGLTNIEWHAPHPRAFRRELKGWLFVASIASIGVATYLRWSALFVVPFLIAWAVIGARQTIKYLRWGTTDEAILFTSGWLWRRTVVVRFAKIQAVSLHETPFDRRHGMARVHVDAAGASESTAIRIPYFGRHTAEELHAHLAAEAARRELAW